MCVILNKYISLALGMINNMLYLLHCHRVLIVHPTIARMQAQCVEEYKRTTILLVFFAR